ncbi:MAG: ATP-binding protein [Acidobacteriia bacterium]|nr:ATP-binding protein [Terriglobia bacterium]
MEIDDNIHEALFSDTTLTLGELHWTVLKAARTMERERWDKVELEFGCRYEDTEFGKEIGMDEIHWWIFEKEPDIDELLAKSEEALKAAQVLKVASANFKASEPESYQKLLLSLRNFAEQHRNQIDALHDYVMWLAKRHPMAPRILFTYRVWGSTRMADRDFNVDNEETARSDLSKLRAVTEIVLGVRHSGWLVYDKVEGELGYEMYESMDPEDTPDDAVIVVPEGQVVRRTAYEVYDNCATYFAETRDSLRNIVVDIYKMKDQRDLFQSDKFWREFIPKAAKAKTAEQQLWDFKETLTVWHPVKNEEDRRKARVIFAEDVASFANTSGGVLVVGVTDKREIVGIGDGKELENRLKVARDVIAAHLNYDHEIALFRQVAVGEKNQEKICLVVVISQAYKPVAVNDGAGRFSYPVRRETGISRVAREDVPIGKLHLKSDNRDFMSGLKQFVRDN